MTVQKNKCCLVGGAFAKFSLRIKSIWVGYNIFYDKISLLKNVHLHEN